MIKNMKIFSDNQLQQPLTSPPLEQTIKQVCENKDVFINIFKSRGKRWGGKQSASGYGSELNTTENIRKELPLLINKYEIKSLCDCPCGDFFWMSKAIDSLNINKYIGGDVVEEMISELKKYANNKVDFMVLDLLNDKIPLADMIICRDCIVHMSQDAAIKAINTIKNSEAKYVLLTHFPDIKKNNMAQRYPAGWRPFNLLIEPFNLSKPIEIIFENEVNMKTYGRKTMSLWKIEDIK